MSCALGLMSQPFRQDPVTPHEETNTDRSLADVYYTAAKKRIGLLGATSFLYIQSTFLSGVYEMYALRPLIAWYSFHSACSAMQLYFQAKELGSESSATRSLEQRLHWSCLKSER
jgi:hypothetical protein